MSDQLSFTNFDFTTLQKPKTKPKKIVEKIYSVSEVLDEINSILQPLDYTVQGEISRINERGGAIYFTVCDTEEKAVMDCIVWRSKLASLGISLKTGLEVKIIGSPHVYKPSGKFSFIANYITPVGEGALKQAFEKLKKKLEAEGCFDISHKRKIPSYVSSIGLITSDNADAKKDFLTHLGQHGIKIYFHDARVEGIRAVDTVVKAIHWFNENPVDIQVLVVTRGGGSLESLQAFNSEEVAKAMYSSRIPVISAIGHENDVTIADLVADVRASTPTDAGKILSADWNEAVVRINEVEENIYASFRMRCNELRNELTRMQQNFISAYKKSLDQYSDKIDAVDRSLSSSFQEMLRRFKYITDGFTLCFNRFITSYSAANNEINTIENDLQNNSARWYAFVKKHIDSHEKDLRLSDPELKLKQGYSISFDKNKKVIKSTEQIAISEHVTIKLYAGEITVHVDRIK